ncbi:MAG: TIGR01458 family HAD-type hydrolase [Acidobacteria bacterium]|nr:TIGR01458 family HAD-type hydrolase [Acidobacteriota bacterium]
MPPLPRERVDACLIDLDGTIYFAGKEIPGAAAAVRRIREAGLPVAFATNTTRRPRSQLVEELRDLGVEAQAQEVFTAPVAAARWLSANEARRVSLLIPEATHEEFSVFEISDVRPQFVVVGDLGREWTFDRLNTAFRCLLDGARLIAIQRNRQWDAGTGPQLDAGPFVAALEYASGREAVLVGKPSPAFFEQAAASLGVRKERLLVVGDGIETDVAGAQAAGCLGVAVRTGTFDEEKLPALLMPPEAILDSIAGLAAWLGII